MVKATVEARMGAHCRSAFVDLMAAGWLEALVRHCQQIRKLMVKSRVDEKGLCGDGFSTPR